jgi:uncharacterized membrane protein YkvA (DUF1232 family)
VSVAERLRRWAATLAHEITTLTIAYRDPRTPFAARAAIAVVLAYALSPLDLIPDPIPVLGQLDDLVLVPLGIALVLRLLPPEVLRDAREAAHARPPGRALRRLALLGMLAVAALWLGLLVLLLRSALHRPT